MQESVSYIGRHKSELDTPALLINLDIMENNIQKIGRLFHDCPAQN